MIHSAIEVKSIEDAMRHWKPWFECDREERQIKKRLLRAEKYKAKQERGWHERQVITKQDQMAIKRMMFQPLESRWPKCPGRSRRKRKAYEKQGDFSHSEKNHVCEDCRCGHVAGWGTHGAHYRANLGYDVDFWGLGVQSGHYGVGWCKTCEKYREENALVYAFNQMKALQNQGKSYHPQRDYLQLSQSQGAEAEAAVEIRKGMDLIERTLIEFEDRCIRGPEKTSEIVRSLNSLEEAIKECDVPDGEQLQKILDAIDNRIFVESTLTERGKEGPVTCSDDTRMKLALKFAEALSKLTKDRYTIQSSSLVHIDEVNRRIPRMFELAFRFIMDENDKRIFISDMADIWGAIPPAKNTSR